MTTLGIFVLLKLAEVAAAALVVLWLYYIGKHLLRLWAWVLDDEHGSLREMVDTPTPGDRVITVFFAVAIITLVAVSARGAWAILSFNWEWASQLAGGQ